MLNPFDGMQAVRGWSARCRELHMVAFYARLRLEIRSETRSFLSRSTPRLRRLKHPYSSTQAMNYNKELADGRLPPLYLDAVSDGFPELKIVALRRCPGWPELVGVGLPPPNVYIGARLPPVLERPVETHLARLGWKMLMRAFRRTGTMNSQGQLVLCRGAPRFRVCPRSRGQTRRVSDLAPLLIARAR